MHFEVETKVKVKNIKNLREKIREIAKFYKKVKKEDIYYTYKTTKGYPKERFRIRKSNGKYVINFKKRPKDLSKEVLVKKEFEFAIRDIASFTEFLKEFNFKPFIHKIKHSEIYKYKNMVIELNRAIHLGWFMEIEVLCKKEQIKNAKLNIKQLIKRLNIKKSEIDNTGYTIMLYKKGVRW